jgi:isoaspartyl peptidase/L-asparaginase-like protein (Ntn-hydrolase superfamily)
MKLESSFNPIKIAVNVMLHEERLMLGHLAEALSANDGWQFGENLATLSKGGWDSQLVLKLIQSVFRATARGG